MSILNDEEIKLLKYYKIRLVAWFGLLLLSGFIIFLSSILIDSKFFLYLNYFFYSIGILVIAGMIIDTLTQRADLFIISSAISQLIFILLFGFLTLISLNYSMIYWNKESNCLLFVFIGCLYLIIQIKGIIDWKKIFSDLEHQSFINTADGIYSIMKEMKTKTKLFDRSIVFSLGISFLVIFAIFYSKKNILLSLDPRLLIAISCGFYILFFLLFKQSKLFSRLIVVKKWEKLNNKKLFTELKKFYKTEPEINQWRRERGLKPIKIKSPFFFGNIEK